ncbi:MAG: hypothetical protein Ct9H300mP1_39080 [Planctomycetaceae bacterium]|nr:MAG: hypothetical protein Ct9H300mP1_39080 [Planctomycetaceae bacterium]
MPTIKFTREKKSVEVESGQKIRNVALQEGIEGYPWMHRVLHCPGLGMCTSCRVRIKKEDKLIAPSRRCGEKLNMFLNPLSFLPGWIPATPRRSG